MTKTQKIAIISVCAIAVILVGAILLFMDVFPEADKVSFKHDEQAKIIKYTGYGYGVTVDYNNKFQIKELKNKNKNILASEKGIFVECLTGDSTYSSLLLDSSPVVSYTMIDEKTYTTEFNFSDNIVDYKVVIYFNPEYSEVVFERTFKCEVSLKAQGFPSINLQQDAIENIRWHRSGSNFWISGKASSMRNFLSAGKGYLAEKGEHGYELGNIKRSMEDITFSLISSPGEEYAFMFDGKSDRNYATEVQRYEEGNLKNLSMNVVIAPPEKELVYLGTEDGWGSYQGRTVSQGKDVYRPMKMSAGQTDSVSFTIRPKDYDSYFDLGKLNGVDETLLSQALNNYARLMILDHDMGSSVESPNHFLEVPALEQHWNTNLISLFLDDAAINAQMNGMRVIRDKLQAQDGHVRNPYPWITYDDWGSKYSDMMPGYVLSVLQLYNITGDKAFLDEMVESMIKAMDSQKKRYLDGKVYLCKNLNNDKELNPNDYWEHTKGEYNGYTSAMYYEALSKFSVILEALYGDKYANKAKEFSDIASKIKEDFNKLWSDKTNTYLYGSENLDVLYLPVQGAVIRGGLVEKDRAYKMVESVERMHAVYNLPFHVMNVLDLLQVDTPADQSNDYNKSMLGMNGGWYGAPDGDFYSGFPIYGDRTLMPRYINRFTEVFNKTGFIGATAYKRDGVTPADYGWYDSMPTLAYPIYGLYTYAYGFQPEYDRLNIAPFIDKSMEGSVVKYRFRQVDMEVKYDSMYEFEIYIKSIPAPIYFLFINQTSDKEYEVIVNGNKRKVIADKNGIVTVLVENVGKTIVKILNPDSEDKTISSFVNKPVIVSSTKDGDTSTKYWSTCITDGMLDRYWTPDSNDEEKYAIVALGSKAKVNKMILTLKDNEGIKYVIEGSNDPLFKEWKKLCDNSKKAVNGDTIIDEIDGSYHYLRYRFLSDSQIVKVVEIEIGK